MSAARLPVRDDRVVALRVVGLAGLSAVWPMYQRGLHDTYCGIGAGDLAAGPELPAGVTTVLVAGTSGGEIVGGVLVRNRTELARHAGLAHLADAIAEREPEGVNELGGGWLRPAWRGAGLGTALLREALLAAADGGRWTVTFANQFSIGTGVRAGFVPDARFRDLPFPDGRFRSTLCWYDHQGAGR